MGPTGVGPTGEGPTDVGPTDVGPDGGTGVGLSDDELGTWVGGLDVGSGGAAITARDAGTQDAVTTLAAIQAYPSETEGYATYHHVSSAFLPVMVRVLPVGAKPFML